MAKRKLIIIWFGLCLVCAFIYLPGLSRLTELKERTKELDREIEEARASNRKLEEEKERLQNDPVYIEKVAREKLGLAREGEVIYRIIPSENN